MRSRHAFPPFTGVGLWFVLLLQAVAVAVAVPTTAYAHGDTLKVVVTGQKAGRVTADITWENDGDAVDETVAGTVNAVSADGARSAGPWRLVRDTGDKAGWTTAEVLPPGTWKVSVDVGFPSLGHGDREVNVPVVDPAPPATPSVPATPEPTVSSATPATSPAPATPATSAAPSPAAPSASPTANGRDSGDRTDSGDGTVWWTTAGVAATALAGAAGGLFLRRARARRR
ncbi:MULTISPECIES: hypothetical protein [unclassified Streptomyces]|uniref:hypothetical protein n=1 Tax=unclassified Streptomyces TaxID=2593676 RepID=UPI001BE6C7E2|nr:MULTISPECIES: hypothetical protein [unclassified Streptomyces]MBT2406137.1 hypothetical protein [Streptomyces sp. ISL-21]MBT2459490.1 hypothetical protein [Streptomyces sp. ISL-86]MBT2609195.1 hypothetical protein [Streptomyces sp. ISL-87]